MDQAYLEHAFGSGSIHELASGIDIVAGEYVDPLRGVATCLVEYVPSGLHLTDEVTTLLVGWTREHYPSCPEILVRLQEVDDFLPGFADHIYYVVLADDPPPATFDDVDVRVRPAGPADRQNLLDWLVMAFRDALAVQDGVVADEELREQALGVLDHESSRSFVAVADEEVIGHVTILTDQVDDLTGLRHVELMDVLVTAPDRLGSAGRDALVRAAWAAARDTGLPLLGHVVCHDPGSATAGRERAVLAGLLSTGWTFHHKYQRFSISPDLRGD